MTKRTYSPDTLHREVVLQNHIIDQLVAQQGYRHRHTDDYDRAAALDKGLVLEFVKATQPDEWRRLEEYYSPSAEDEFFKQLIKALKSRSVLDVLRQGIKLVPGIELRLCYFKPASRVNEELAQLYEANVLSVIDELKYSTKKENRLDIALFVNGIPLATIECKNISTGSNFHHAEIQYKKDRPPAGEPLLTFKQGALVHFALDQDNVSMTTRLANGNTSFLPFNRGNDGGAGNPDIKDEFRIAYLYADQPEGKAIFSRDILLDIVGRFMLLDSDKRGKEAMLFPRFQQLDAVLKMLTHAKQNGSGHNYLIQHSAGSGKSNTIAWTTHHLINLHDESEQPVFNAAIIVTDRVVLDRQLQKTIAQFEQTPGVVKKIEGTSQQLKEAIEQGARIIVTTIHKFSTDHLKEISGQDSRRFAILVDEAHGSQSGAHADNLSKTLTRQEQKDPHDNLENIVAQHQKQRGPQSNISYFAFTATPRNVTLERFGTKGQDGLPYPFHLYSMRQAIEEGFILDVLQNYTTYKQYYKLEKAIEDDPEFQARKAQRRVARFATLHPTAIAQKVEIIVEHFRRHLMKELNGEAKAMVVTQSREHALRYYFEIKKYIEENECHGIKAIVAFSGELTFEGETYTEAGLNGFSETELPNNFDTSEYQLLIVAEKYQTGFDQPKLCAMYVDRKLEGLQAVQTLSRLNRKARGKEHTHILDFQNTTEDIQGAFNPYFGATLLEEISDPNQIYTLEQRIKSFFIVDEEEITRFAEIYYKELLTSASKAHLERIVRNAVQRFDHEEDEGKQEEFRQLLKSYMRFYSFISQVVRLEDTSLEKLFAYVSWLSRLLPDREVPPDIEITDDLLKLQALRVEQKEQGSASLHPDTDATLFPIERFGANPYTEDEERSLSEIVDSFNQGHGTNFTKKDFLRLEQVKHDILEDENLRNMLKKNPPDIVYETFKEAFFEGAIKLFERDSKLQNIIMTDADVRDKAIRHFFGRARREVMSNTKVLNRQ